MNCPNETEWVLYASGELPPDRRQALDAHLAGCDACRREAQTLARGLAALATLDREPTVRPLVMETLRTRARKETQPSVVSILRRYRWVAAAAAVVVLAIGLATLMPQTGEPTAITAARAWVTDSHLQEEIAEITAGVEMLEACSNGKAPDVTNDAGDDDQSLDELEFFFDQLRAEVDA
ncbi:MAG: zf-HC2 domain-containing protein [Planctomycetota bacterium]|nr:zf-HC2 domain-containing protein [Planctomycetota bacterium]